MTIYLATDHAGFALKEEVKQHLIDAGYAVEDCGALELNPADDYPDFIRVAAEKVAQNPESRGIVFGGSGQGEAMVANRVKGIRAAVMYSYDVDIVRLSREHNDANVLSIGARFIKEKKALKAIDMWLNAPFSNEERHKRRIDKID